MKALAAILILAVLGGCSTMQAIGGAAADFAVDITTPAPAPGAGKICDRGCVRSELQRARILHYGQYGR